MFKNRKDKNTHGYRVIKTARTLAEINEAVGVGYTPIIREITEPDVTFTYYRVVQWRFETAGTRVPVYSIPKKLVTVLER